MAGILFRTVHDTRKAILGLRFDGSETSVTSWDDQADRRNQGPRGINPVPSMQGRPGQHRSSRFSTDLRVGEGGSGRRTGDCAKSHGADVPRRSGVRAADVTQRRGRATSRGGNVSNEQTRQAEMEGTRSEPADLPRLDCGQGLWPRRAIGPDREWLTLASGSGSAAGRSGSLIAAEADPATDKGSRRSGGPRRREQVAPGPDRRTASTRSRVPSDQTERRFHSSNPRPEGCGRRYGSRSASSRPDDPERAAAVAVPFAPADNSVATIARRAMRVDGRS